MKAKAMIVALAAVAACTGEAPPAPPAVAVAPAPSVLDAPARGRAEFTVRTVARAPSGLDLEVRGVECTAASGGEVVAFHSPARVAITDAGTGVRVQCAGGGRQGAALVQARQDYETGGWRAWPSIGIGIGTGGGVDLGVGANVSPVPVPAGLVYPDLRLALR
jgi:hypothetical protein